MEEKIDKALEIVIVFLLGIILGFTLSHMDMGEESKMKACENLFVSQSYQPNLEG